MDLFPQYRRELIEKQDKPPELRWFMPADYVGDVSQETDLEPCEWDEADYFPAQPVSVADPDSLT